MPENNQEGKPKRKYNLTKPKPNKREQILQATIKVMGHFGYDGTTMDRIAVEAGVSRSLVTKHFGTKEEIAAICIGRICDTLIDKMQRISKSSVNYREQTDRIFSLVQSSQNEIRLLITLMATPALEHTLRNAVPDLAKSTQQIVANHNADNPQDIAALSYTMTALYFNYVLTGRKELYERAKANVLQHYTGEK
ncbi:MAG: TetR/AcrR family transcriptional regulator [Oscillospiraceae bacterium]|nr:TetR/AcrR family transcriptional regulator [Oscillospiraceae bacterium]